MKKLIFSLFFFSLTIGLSAQLTRLELAPNQTSAFSGNLEQGTVMTDLSWAWNSSVACFPANQSDHFQGVHVLYVVDVPRYTELEITVIPADVDADYSLYAYEVGQVSESNLVPNLSRCIRCEADHKRDYPMRGRPAQTHTRTVTDILAINNPYQAIIGVVGPAGVTEGDFELQIQVKGR